MITGIVDHTLRTGNGEGGVRSNLFGDSHYRFKHFLYRAIDLVYQTNRLGFFRTNTLSGVGHLPRPTLRNQLDQARVCADICGHSNGGLVD